MSEVERPSAGLAAQVVDRLVEAGLVRPERRDHIQAKIASGTIKGEDWRLEIDAAAEKAAAR